MNSEFVTQKTPFLKISSFGNFSKPDNDTDKPESIILYNRMQT
jgi:hypothetical protein